MENEIAELKKQIDELKGKIRNETENSPVQPLPSPGPLNYEEVDEYAWEAPIRVFSPWDNQKITTLLLVIAIIAIILLYLREFILLLTVLLIAGVGVALVKVPPATTKHKITNKGILSYDKLYLWEDLTNFWLANKNGQIVLYVHTKLPYPEKFFFVVPQEHIEKVTTTISKYLKYYERRQEQGHIGKLNDGIYIKFNDIKSHYPSTNS